MPYEQMGLFSGTISTLGDDPTGLYLAGVEAVVKKILDQIRSRKPDPVYFLQGEETFYIDVVANVLAEEFLSEQDRAFNQVILYGRETNVNTILGHARRFPMMAEHQVVIVREAQEIPDLYKEPQSKLLLEYLSRPVPSTVLLFCHMHKSLDKRREFGKKAEQAGVVTTFKKLQDFKLADFVMNYVKERGYRMEEGAAQLLAESTGNDLNRLAHEADKLFIGHPQGYLVRADQVMNEVGVSREFNIFELQKAVVTRNATRIYTIVRYFQANPKKNPAIPSLAFLYSFFSRLLLASTMSDRSPSALARQLKIPPMVAGEYETALRNYDGNRIRECIRIIKEADLRVKGFGGSDDEGQVLQETLFRLIA